MMVVPDFRSDLPKTPQAASTAAFTPQAPIEIPTPIAVKDPLVSLTISIFSHSISIVLEI
jgi:hypothetical protein